MTIEYARKRHRSRWIAVGILALAVLGGCGSGEQRFELSGTITYEGRPVPAGYIVFNPDAAAGNTGPGSTADIRDGRYTTPPGGGTMGGPHTVSIFGFDGTPYTMEGGMPNPMGKPLFTTDLRVDLPKQRASHDFALPEPPR